jgi:hypothetical protein
MQQQGSGAGPPGAPRSSNPARVSTQSTAATGSNISPSFLGCAAPTGSTSRPSRPTLPGAALAPPSPTLASATGTHCFWTRMCLVWHCSQQEIRCGWLPCMAAGSSLCMKILIPQSSLVPSPLGRNHKSFMDMSERAFNRLACLLASLQVSATGRQAPGYPPSCPPCSNSPTMGQ